MTRPRSVALEHAIRAQADAAGRRAHVHSLTGSITSGAPGSIAVALLDGQRLLVKSSRSQAAVRVVQEAVAVHAVASVPRR